MNERRMDGWDETGAAGEWADQDESDEGEAWEEERPARGGAARDAPHDDESYDSPWRSWPAWPTWQAALLAGLRQLPSAEVTWEAVGIMRDAWLRATSEVLRGAAAVAELEAERRRGRAGRRREQRGRAEKVGLGDDAERPE